MIVFVHGVPETAAVWTKVRDAIDRESVALALPGFGCARPVEFGATKDDYVQWLVGELDRLDEPIDLVGHDWGGALTYRVATAYGDRLHSWAADVANLAHPDYEWHDFAKLWQTPGEGEAFIESQEAQAPEDRAPLFEAMGVPADDALQMASDSDATMGACILALYRSAVPNAHEHWGPWSATKAPGLVLYPSDDPFGDQRLATEVADARVPASRPSTGPGTSGPIRSRTRPRRSSSPSGVRCPSRPLARKLPLGPQRKGLPAPLSRETGGPTR